MQGGDQCDGIVQVNALESELLAVGSERERQDAPQKLAGSRRVVRQLVEQIERVEANTARKVKTVTADASYAHSKNYMALENRRIDAVIPPQAESKHPKRIPIRRFKYDGRHKVVRCPGGKVLRRSSCNSKRWLYRAATADCRACPLRKRCLSPSASSRTLVIAHGYEALLRARRRKVVGWDKPTRRAYHRHRWRVEGAHGEAAKWHNLGRAHRRRLWNVRIQAYLTAAVMNLKRLAAASIAPPTAKAAIQRSVAALLWLLHQLCSRRPSAQPYSLRINRLRVSELTNLISVRQAA